MAVPNVVESIPRIMPGRRVRFTIDLYPMLGDYLDGPYRAVTGRREPGPPE